MTIRSYYRAALVLPLAVPTFFTALLLSGGVPRSLWSIYFYFGASAVIGGVPYLLFAAGFLAWMRHLREDELRTAVLAAPLAYAGVLVACGLAYVLVDGYAVERLSGMGPLFGFGVLFGYFYVLVAEAGRLLLRPRSEVPPAPA